MSALDQVRDGKMVGRTRFDLSVRRGGFQEASRLGRFLRIALNSGCELEYHLIAARDVEAISETDSDDLICQVVDVRKSCMA